MSRKGLLRWDPPVPVGTDGIPRKKMVASVEADVDQMHRDILNAMFPPIEFEEDGVKYTQSVCITGIAKPDVVKLKTQLTNLFHARKARNTGVCLIRSQLYSQCFDELIRQVTIDCNPRGRLLQRVREHYRMTLNSYKELYDTSLDWGSRKRMQVDQGVADLRAYNIELKERRRTLELQANDLQLMLDNLEKKIAEHKALREKDHTDEIAFLKRQGQMTKAQLDMLNSQSK